MISRNQLYQSPEYWMERIQNDLFRALNEYKVEKGLNQTQLANDLGFSKGYISQVLNGNFNYSLKKLIDLSLAVGVVPDVDFKDIQDYIDEEESRLDRMSETGFTKVAKIEGISQAQTLYVNLSSEMEKMVG